MGNQQQSEMAKRDARVSRKDAKQKKEFGRKDSESLSQVSWLDSTPANVVEMIDAITQATGAVMFTRSQDGGTLGIRVYHDDYTLKTYWARPGDELDVLISDITGDIST